MGDFLVILSLNDQKITPPCLKEKRPVEKKLREKKARVLER